MSMRRAEALQMVMSVLRLLRRWRNMTGSILAVRWSEQVRHNSCQLNSTAVEFVGQRSPSTA